MSDEILKEHDHFEEWKFECSINKKMKVCCNKRTKKPAMLCFKRKKSCTGCKIPRMWETEGLTLAERCHNEAQQKQRRKAKTEGEIASSTDDVEWKYGNSSSENSKNFCFS